MAHERKEVKKLSSPNDEKFQLSSSSDDDDLSKESDDENATKTIKEIFRRSEKYDDTKGNAVKKEKKSEKGESYQKLNTDCLLLRTEDIEIQECQERQFCNLLQDIKSQNLLISKYKMKLKELCEKKGVDNNDVDAVWDLKILLQAEQDRLNDLISLAVIQKTDNERFIKNNENTSKCPEENIDKESQVFDEDEDETFSLLSAEDKTEQRSQDRLFCNLVKEINAKKVLIVNFKEELKHCCAKKCPSIDELKRRKAKKTSLLKQCLQIEKDNLQALRIRATELQRSGEYKFYRKEKPSSVEEENIEKKICKSKKAVTYSTNAEREQQDMHESKDMQKETAIGNHELGVSKEEVEMFSTQQRPLKSENEILSKNPSLHSTEENTEVLKETARENAGYESEEDYVLVLIDIANSIEEEFSKLFYETERSKSLTAIIQLIEENEVNEAQCNMEEGKSISLTAEKIENKGEKPILSNISEECEIFAPQQRPSTSGSFENRESQENSELKIDTPREKIDVQGNIAEFAEYTKGEKDVENYDEKNKMLPTIERQEKQPQNSIKDNKKSNSESIEHQKQENNYESEKEVGNMINEKTLNIANECEIFSTQESQCNSKDHEMLKSQESLQAEKKFPGNELKVDLKEMEPQMNKENFYKEEKETQLVADENTGKGSKYSDETDELVPSMEKENHDLESQEQIIQNFKEDSEKYKCTSEKEMQEIEENDNQADATLNEIENTEQESLVKNSAKESLGKKTEEVSLLKTTGKDSLDTNNQEKSLDKNVEEESVNKMVYKQLDYENQHAHFTMKDIKSESPEDMNHNKEIEVFMGQEGSDVVEDERNSPKEENLPTAKASTVELENNANDVENKKGAIIIKNIVKEVGKVGVENETKQSSEKRKLSGEDNLNKPFQETAKPDGIVQNPYTNIQNETQLSDEKTKPEHENRGNQQFKDLTEEIIQSHEESENVGIGYNSTEIQEKKFENDVETTDAGKIPLENKEQRDDKNANDQGKQKQDVQKAIFPSSVQTDSPKQESADNQRLSDPNENQITSNLENENNIDLNHDLRISNDDDEISKLRQFFGIDKEQKDVPRGTEDKKEDVTIKVDGPNIHEEAPPETEELVSLEVCTKSGEYQSKQSSLLRRGIKRKKQSNEELNVFPSQGGQSCKKRQRIPHIKDMSWVRRDNPYVYCITASKPCVYYTHKELHSKPSTTKEESKEKLKKHHNLYREEEFHTHALADKLDTCDYERQNCQCANLPREFRSQRRIAPDLKEDLRGVCAEYKTELQEPKGKCSKTLHRNLQVEDCEEYENYEECEETQKENETIFNKLAMEIQEHYKEKYTQTEDYTKSIEENNGIEETENIEEENDDEIFSLVNKEFTDLQEWQYKRFCNLLKEIKFQNKVLANYNEEMKKLKAKRCLAPKDVKDMALFEECIRIGKANLENLTKTAIHIKCFQLKDYKRSVEVQTVVNIQ